MAEFRPDKTPEWASDPAADVVEPSSGQKGDGWDVDDKPPSGWLNWLQNNAYRWLEFYRHLVLDNWQVVELEDTAAWGDIIYTIFRSSQNNPGFLVCAGEDGIQTSVSGKSKSWIERLATGTWRCGTATNHASTAALVAGNAAAIRTSNDGITWTIRTAAGGFVGTFYGACYAEAAGTPYIVLVGSGGTIQYSTDGGQNWNSATAAGGYVGDFRSVAWGKVGAGPINRVVAVGANGEIQYSDGVSVGWTKSTVDAGYVGEFRGVIFGEFPFFGNNGVFVAVGENNEIQYSVDGQTFYRATVPALIAGDFNAVAWAFPGFLAVGEDGRMISSVDGQNWAKNFLGYSMGAENNLRTVGHDYNGFFIGGNTLADGVRSVIWESLRGGGYDIF